MSNLNELATKLKSEGNTYKQVAQKLFEQGFKSPRGNKPFTTGYIAALTASKNVSKKAKAVRKEPAKAAATTVNDRDGARNITVETFLQIFPKLKLSRQDRIDLVTKILG